MEETGVLGENHRPALSHRQTLSHNVVSSTPRYDRDSNSQCLNEEYYGNTQCTIKTCGSILITDSIVTSNLTPKAYNIALAMGI